jgi:large subunit ribosomal protein L13
MHPFRASGGTEGSAALRTYTTRLGSEPGTLLVALLPQRSVTLLERAILTKLCLVRVLHPEGTAPDKGAPFILSISTERPMKTFSAKPAEVTHEWFVLDATDKVLGRVASEVALRLRGKHKPIYTPHVDTGDYIVVVNADKIRVTGNKANDKIYYRHTGYPGGIYGTKFKDMQARHPGRALEKAVKGMLPKGPLGYAMVKKLKVYAGDVHPHTAQQPKTLVL